MGFHRIRHSIIGNFVILTTCFLLVSSPILAAPKAKTIEHWDTSNEQSTTTVNHSTWQKILRRYVIKHPSGINRVDYQTLQVEGLKELGSYLEYLGSRKPTSLNKAEQKAYWLNLYNAGLVFIVASNYPLDTVRDIKPWKIKFITIEDNLLTLDNIEHGILRPIYMDNRVHYGFACASIGCPSLSRTAFTGTNVDAQLRQLGMDFINHERGAKLEGSTLFLSRIFKWYLDDFGGSEEALIEYIKYFAKPDLKRKLDQGYKKIEFYKHDWNLNKPN